MNATADVAAGDVLALYEGLGEAEGADQRADVDDDQGQGHGAEVAPAPGAG